MKAVYNNIDFTQGPHIAGIKKIQVVPREWLETDLVPDFNTGKIITAVDLIAGASFIELNFTQESYEFTEKPKRDKNGDFFETNITGLVNDLDATIYQLLETYRQHQFVVIATDRQGRQRICGSKDAGMKFTFGTKHVNTQGGTLQVIADLDMQTATAAPFYEV